MTKIVLTMKWHRNIMVLTDKDIKRKKLERMKYVVITERHNKELKQEFEDSFKALETLISSSELFKEDIKVKDMKIYMVISE